MLSPNAVCMQTSLEQMWEEHREYVRRVLISLTKDIDLADDIVQETYLRACTGFDCYRGGDAKAWFTSIAKNTFYSSVRRKYYNSEVSLDKDVPAEYDVLGSSNHITSVAIRQAISGLPDAMRQALIMKHYGGFTYAEIARMLGCHQSTAQQRVFRAIRRLREALSATKEELVEMACSAIAGRKLVNYVYGKLSEAGMMAVKMHAAGCPKCRARIDETVSLLKTLDREESAFKVTYISDLDYSYMLAVYSAEFVESTEKNRGPMGLGYSGNLEFIYATLGDDEVKMEPFRPDPDGPICGYVPHMPRKAGPGELVEVMLVSTTSGPMNRLKGDTVNVQCRMDLTYDAVYTVAIRLMGGASVVRVDPKPAETRTANSRTTVYHRGFASANQQLEWNVDYII